jgi:AmmeMemoRadiSam system protein A
MFDVLTRDDQRQLLRLARAALEARVRGESAPPPEHGGALDEPLGAFVTVHRSGELRGCLGRLDVDAPLGETVADLAAAVAYADRRFVPLTAADLPFVDVEISVLTPEVEVEDVSAIEVGRHGLIVEQHGRRGLLLPQVAPEHGWDRETFLAQTCRKAGLPADAWQCGARILSFEAQVFSERSSATSP